MTNGARHSSQRRNRVELKADCVVLLDRLVADLSGMMTAKQHLQIAEMRMRLAPPVGVRAPIILTGYTRRKKK